MAGGNTFPVPMTIDELEVSKKALQISASHVSRSIQRTSIPRQLDTLRAEYASLGNAEAAVSDALDVALGVS